MAPLKSQTSPVIVLHQGLDTLVLNVYGSLREDVALCLEMAKEDAQASPADEALSPLPPFAGVTPRMQASGAPYYEWRMVSRDLTVLIAKPSRSKRPNAVIRVSSECLWRLGGGGAIAAELAEHYLRVLFDEDGYRVQVSAAHLATDYQGYVLCLSDRRGIVKRPRSIGEHPQHDGELQWWGVREECQSIAAGRSNAIRLNLYDKSAEIVRHDKQWFTALWEQHEGYVTDASVWRVEFQLGREFLREMRIDTLAQLIDGLEGLWAYGMRWFSFRIPNEGDRQHPSRWPVASWWAALSSWQLSETEPLAKVKQVRPKFARLCQGAFGYLTSLMAITEETEPENALTMLLAHMRAEKGLTAMDRALAAKQLRYGGFTMADG